MSRVSKLAALMDDAEADVLAYMGFPSQHRAKIHSTNSLERLNGAHGYHSGERCRLSTADAD
jgi:transposase-like protein